MLKQELQKKGLSHEHAEAGLIEVFDSTKSVYVPSDEDEDTGVLMWNDKDSP